MANIQVSRLASRQDQVLQIPFPTPPPLAAQIDAGVLKQRGAINYDQQLRKWVESVQNVLRLSLRFPQLEQWQEQINNLLALDTSVASMLVTLSQLQLSLSTLTTTVEGNQTDITTLQIQVSQLIIAINEFNQYKHIESAAVNPWTINYGRIVRPGGMRIMRTPSYFNIDSYVTDDSTLGTIIVTFGANTQGIAILTFS